MNKITFLDNRDKLEITNKSASAITNIIAGGEKSLTINNVSSLDHKCSCKLTSDTYEAYVNIFDVSTLYVGMYQDTAAPNLIIDNEANGSFTVSGKIPPYDSLYCMGKIENLTKGITYTFSIRNSKGQAHGVRLIKFTANNDYIGEVDVSTPYTFTFEEENVEFYRFIDWLPTPGDGETEVELEETTYQIQLEEGSQMTEWVPAGEAKQIPYVTDFSTVKVIANDEFYMPNADGIVTGIISKSPEMTVTTNNEYVNITDFVYNVDTKSYVDNNIPEVDLSNYYTKSEVNEALSNIDVNVNLSNYYNKNEIDTKLANIIVISDTAPSNPVEGMIWIQPIL